MAPKFSAAEITEIGVRIEENGRAFYTGAAEKAVDSGIADVFRFLAAEEDKHIGAFRGLLSQTEESDAEGGGYNDEYFAYLRSLGDEHVFTREKAGASVLAYINDDIEALNMALGFEKDSILLFTEFLNVVKGGARDLVLELIRQERQHFRKLAELKDALLKKKSIMDG